MTMAIRNYCIDYSTNLVIKKKIEQSLGESSNLCFEETTWNWEFLSQKQVLIEHLLTARPWDKMMNRELLSFWERIFQEGRQQKDRQLK